MHHVLRSDGATTEAGKGDAVLDEIYAGPKTSLRLIHDKVLAAVKTFGPFEIAPKKGYLSLRGKKQFAMIGPATKSQIEIGLNMKGVAARGRLIANPPGGMCQYRVRVGDAAEVDAELIAWIRQAYERAQ